MDMTILLCINEMSGTKRSASCGELFQKFNILPLATEFVFSSSSFVVDKIEKFQMYSDIHNISTRYRYNPHVPNTNFSKYQKGVNILELSYSIIFHLLSKV
jgi:hypothetical protein